MMHEYLKEYIPINAPLSHEQRTVFLEHGKQKQSSCKPKHIIAIRKLGGSFVPCIISSARVPI